MSAPINDPTTPTQSGNASLPETAYSDALVPARPKDSLALIQSRLRKAKALTDELADYFSARRELEDSYLKALSKLSRRPFLTDASVLGPGFSMVYERLIAELGETASVHSELEKKIADECEMPFRVMANKGEWGRVKEYDDSLTSTIKEIGSLESQLQKDQKKAETASSKKASTLHSKAADTDRSLQSSLDDWETEAPFAFEAYQRIDRNRLEAMKEIVTKFETAQADAAQRLMNITENSMQIALAFEPEREMKNWLRTNSLPRLRASGGASRIARANGSRNEREGTPASMMSSNTTTTNGGTVRPATGNAPSAISEFGASRGHPANQSRTSLASSHQMESISTMNSRPGQGLPPSSSSAAPPVPSNSEKSSSGGGSTLKNAFSRIGRGRANKDKNDMNTVYGTLNEDAGPSTERTSTSTARGNMGPPSAPSDRPGTSRTTTEERSSGFGPAATGLGAGVAAGGLMQPMLPTRGGSGSSQIAQSNAPQVDAEGYSIPPPDRKPWEAGGSGSSNLMDDADGNNEVLDEGFTAPNPLRASSMNIYASPIQSGDQAGDKEALERVKSTLLTARSPSAGPTRRNTTRRDRRDVRATTYNPTLPSSDSNDGSRPMSQFGLPMVSRDPSNIGGPSSSAPSPAQSHFSSGFNGAPGLGDHRTQSIVSMSSTANPFDVSSSTMGVGASAGGAIASSTGSGSSGLRGSITETVNALFNGRDLARILVVGELSLSLKDIPASQASSPLHLRIESFEQLEKAAPNPQFLKPVDGAHGEYWLDTPALLALSAGQANGATAVVLKYQLHVSESSKETYLPLQVHSQWRCEPHQSSLLLTYTPTSNSKISEPTPTSIHTPSDQPSEPVLTDLSFLTGIEPTSTNVTNVMSKPTGTWSGEKKKIMWKLNEQVSLTNPVTSKVLARFQVDSVTIAQPTQIRWRVQGRTVSKIDVSLIGSNDLKFEEIRRNCVSGKFIANP